MTYFVYIMTNKRKNVLYVGMTSHLQGRVWQHKTKYYPRGFTCRYRVDRLVYYEEYQDVYEAIAREKQIKGYRREKKERLIKGMNPCWHDLSDGWYI